MLGVVGLLLSLALCWALIAATRRQTRHFRSLVTSSTDLVLVFGGGGCCYASESVTAMVGRPSAEILAGGFAGFVHRDDRIALESAVTHAEPHELLFRVQNKFGEWRHLEAHITDLRSVRELRGVVVNARDVTERVELEEQLTQQAFYDGLTGRGSAATSSLCCSKAQTRPARLRRPTVCWRASRSRSPLPDTSWRLGRASAWSSIPKARRSGRS